MLQILHLGEPVFIFQDHNPINRLQHGKISFIKIVCGIIDVMCEKSRMNPPKSKLKQDITRL